MFLPCSTTEWRLSTAAISCLLASIALLLSVTRLSKLTTSPSTLVTRSPNLVILLLLFWIACLLDSMLPSFTVTRPSKPAMSLAFLFALVSTNLSWFTFTASLPFTPSFTLVIFWLPAFKPFSSTTTSPTVTLLKFTSF